MEYPRPIPERPGVPPPRASPCFRSGSRPPSRRGSASFSSRTRSPRRRPKSLARCRATPIARPRLQQHVPAPVQVGARLRADARRPERHPLHRACRFITSPLRFVLPARPANILASSVHTRTRSGAPSGPSPLRFERALVPSEHHRLVRLRELLRRRVALDAAGEPGAIDHRLLEVTVRDVDPIPPGRGRGDTPERLQGEEVTASLRGSRPPPPFSSRASPMAMAASRCAGAERSRSARREAHHRGVNLVDPHLIARAREARERAGSEPRDAEYERVGTAREARRHLGEGVPGPSTADPVPVELPQHPQRPGDVIVAEGAPIPVGTRNITASAPASRAGRARRTSRAGAASAVSAAHAPNAIGESASPPASPMPPSTTEIPATTTPSATAAAT